jgi:hypothetical protein
VNAFSYLIAFASVVLGLAVTDLAYSVHRLLRVGDRVRWGILAPLAGLLSFLKILVQWWIWYNGWTMGDALSFRIFALIIAATMLLFLMAATALPDDLPAEGVIDLDAGYMATRRRFWLLLLAHTLLMGGVGLYLVWRAHLPVVFVRMWPMLVAALFSIVPLLSRARWVHAVVMAGMAVTLMATTASQTLDG